MILFVIDALICFSLGVLYAQKKYAKFVAVEFERVRKEAAEEIESTRKKAFEEATEYFKALNDSSL